MKKPYMPLALFVLVAMTAITSGCSKECVDKIKKHVNTRNVVAAAAVTGVAATGYCCRHKLGLRRKKKASVASEYVSIEDNSTTE